ncbi:hypothetical protein Fmac_024004 [Flemingia macrophylla]|uniref:F-box domain-containing protein n=1 Tax=Flemingia macrophylla TaxID=520843 RepID=A0ABD1LN55_9FABA
MSENPLFPDEILVEILRRLPPKSAVRCTSVCKSWRCLIIHPSFISIHHRHSPSSVLLHSGNHLTLPHCRNSSALLLPSFPHLDSPVVAFSNALICIAYGEHCQPLIICNPSVRRYVTLPTPSHYPCHYFSYIAFAFDFPKCDYKVVRISCMVDDLSFGLSSPKVELYSLATGFWRTRHGVAPVCCITGDAPHSFHDGLVHWIAKRCVGDGWYVFVLSFCFEDELFREIELPESLSWGDAVIVKVVGGGNGKTLSVYHVSAGSPCSCDIWVMKEYGVKESWNKVFGFSMNGFCLEAPSLGIMITDVAIPPLVLYVTNATGEVLLLMYVAGRRSLYSLDMEGKWFKDLQIEVGTEVVYCGYYSESLVLLNKASGVVSY